MGARSRDEQRRVAIALRAEGKTWVEIAATLRSRWPELNARAAMRVAHGWNQSDAADAWNALWPEPTKGDKDIGLWEIRRPGFATLDRLARLYECSVADLIADLGDYRYLDAVNRSRATTDRSVVHEDGEVERREFLGGAMALAASVVAPDGFTAVCSGPPGSNELDQLRSAIERATRLERASQYAAVNAVLPGLIVEAEHMSSEASDRHRQEGAGLLSRARALRAWVLIKEDRTSEAESETRTALAGARHAEDPVLVGATLRCLGETHMRAGRYDLACDLAVEAAEVIERSQTTGQDALVIQGAGYLSAATACARRGDGRGADELLEAAQAFADRLGRDVSGAAVFGPSNVAIHRVAIPIDLGDPATALQWAERISFHLPAGLGERWARYLIDVARALVAHRRDAEATDALLEAETIAAEEVRSHRLTRSVLTDLLARERRSSTPELRPLASRCGALEPA
jgi:hypothetical protein